MDRRKILIGALSLVAAPGAGWSQTRLPRVGVMLAPAIPNPWMDAFQSTLRDLGYVEGKTIQVEYRSVSGAFEKYPAIAAEFVRMPVDVIVAGGGTAAIRAAKQATTTIPIVFPASRDPVNDGFVQSLARPGWNLTGTSILESEINAKRMQLLREVLPKLQRIVVLFDFQAGVEHVRGTERAASSMGLDLRALQAEKNADFGAIFEKVKEGRADALIVAASAFFNVHRKRLVELALTHRLVVVWEHRAFPEAGALMSYGPDIVELYRSAARYVHRILKGAKPAELPVEQASKLELVINLRTAKAQGLTIPPAILVRADHIIQ